MPKTKSRNAALIGTLDPAAKKFSAKTSTPEVEIKPMTDSVSVSTRFNPEEHDMLDADLVLLARDQVYFYAHRTTLIRDSSNYFGSLVTEFTHDVNVEIDVFQPATDIDFSLIPTVIAVDYPSDVLNLVLHIIYGLSVQAYKPSSTTLHAATTALFELGYNLENVFAHHSEPYMLFLQSAATEPLAMYALAAQYSLENLAVAVSTFTLGAALSDVTDEFAEQMGPIHLRRLFFLHLGRTAALKRLLYPPPSPHISSPDSRCSDQRQHEISRIWAIACASVAITSQPNNLAKSFAPLSAQLSCMECRQVLHERVMVLLNDWNAIKTTI